LFDLSIDPASTTGRKIIKNHAALFFGEHPPGIINNALMEFGALQCVPANPRCEQCPYSECLARQNERVHLLPFKRKGSRVQHRVLHYFVLQWQEGEHSTVLIRKRGDRDIWAHLYDFPSAELQTNTPNTDDALAALTDTCQMSAGTVLQHTYGPYVHLLSHQKISAWFHHLLLPEAPKWSDPNLLATSFSDLSNMAKPKLIVRHLTDMGLFL
jgi:A/G-specific adenine glycosylase